MRRALYIGAVLSVLTLGALYVGCGDVDPAKAPYGTIVTVDPVGVQSTVACLKGQQVEFVDEFIVRALVVGPQATGPGTQGDIDPLPMNDVEVRWTPRFPAGIELYLPEDVIGEVDPLEPPYVDRTDDRGLSEIKVYVNFVASCGSTYSGGLIADIGVSSAMVTMTYQAEEQTEDDDDDTE